METEKNPNAAIKNNRNGKMSRVNVRLMPETVEELEEIARDQGRPVSNLIRQIITKYLDDYNNNRHKS